VVKQCSIDVRKEALLRGPLPEAYGEDPKEEIHKADAISVF
jgi:hypothetical protein